MRRPPRPRAASPGGRPGRYPTGSRGPIPARWCPGRGGTPAAPLPPRAPRRGSGRRRTAGRRGGAAPQPLPCRLGHRGEDRVEGEQRVAGEVHLGDEPLGEGPPEQREVDVGGPPGVVVVLP